MKISVIIATKNEENNISRLLRSLKEQTFRDFETIIVDNNSSDQTKKIASKFTSKIFTHGPERSTQRNYGLEKAIGKYILFLDADMELQKNVLGLCKNLMEKQAKIAGIVIDEVSKGKSFLSKIKALEKSIYGAETELEAARFFKKADLLKIGGYDKELISGEDWDLSERIKKLGNLGRINAKIIHHEKDSFYEDLKKKYYFAKHIQNYARKHPKMFRKQAGFNRILLLFSKPRLIFKNPLEFSGLLFLKLAQYGVYLLAKSKQ